MRLVIFVISFIILIACSPNNSKPETDSKNNTLKIPPSIDSCISSLHIDKLSVETNHFKQYWIKAQKEGYTFKDDTTVPFVKIIFKPRSSKYYTDTLIIPDCKIFDSLNIHRMEIYSSRPIEKNYYPDLNIEEWQFKDSVSAILYSKALKEYLDKGFGLKSPLRITQTGSEVYLFETAAWKFIPELERMQKLFDNNVSLVGDNY